MTWLDPSPLLPIFQQWAERFPVREPFAYRKAELRQARNEFDALQEGKRQCSEAKKANFERLLVESGETRRQRKKRQSRESRERIAKRKL